MARGPIHRGLICGAGQWGEAGRTPQQAADRFDSTKEVMALAEEKTEFDVAPRAKGHRGPTSLNLPTRAGLYLFSAQRGATGVLTRSLNVKQNAVSVPRLDRKVYRDSGGLLGGFEK